MIVLTLVIVVVGVIIIRAILGRYINRWLLENQLIEMVWTVLPAIILLFIAFPSLRLLYLLDEVGEPTLTLKVIGYQWYWGYEYSDFKSLEFESFIVQAQEIAGGGFRSLEVDNRAVLPLSSQIRVLVSASDVIHSWTVPRLGVKVDAVPGRLNQLRFLVERAGVLFGQCSEICGANHRFIPIVLEVVTLEGFLKWV